MTIAVAALLGSFATTSQGAEPAWMKAFDVREDPRPVPARRSVAATWRKSPP